LEPGGGTGKITIIICQDRLSSSWDLNPEFTAKVAEGLSTQTRL